MSNTNTNANTNTTTGTMTKVTVINWNDICQPGVYADTEYPRYYRVPADGLTQNGNPVIQCNNFTVAMISTNPTTPHGEIQKICTTNGLPVAK
jgi:hypothetical protein